MCDKTRLLDGGKAGGCARNFPHDDRSLADAFGLG